ncbi:hypothetical protein OGH69_00895 [Flavobacterium sp. MFBS3-15]|uniref:hypothetical protein n=1 Tax=Flavobacterium sp. MFBS3-15 TaxID=2989816 RepID=UPI002235D06D|nr:hypothetical protein [Flavobacterium sp. MFBS3-15]MCW4467511.1 hypothetical protein [Flavobacterium sp. MFBS3-15]
MNNGGTDDPKDLGSKKMNNQEKKSDRNEGFSGDNLPNNYDPSADKLKMELEKNKEGSTETVQRARDVDEKQATPVSDNDKTTSDDGRVVDKSRGTANEAEDVETAENRDFNSDTEKGRVQAGNDKHRGNTHVGE